MFRKRFYITVYTSLKFSNHSIYSNSIFTSKEVIPIYERMLSENKRLEQQIENLNSQIASLPEGKLICTFDNDYCKWYKSDGHTKTYFSPLSQELTDWMNSPNTGKPLHSEQLIHKSISGNLVRSKSETLIDMTLYVNRIPFRYESPLTIHEVTIFPDFTIRHPQTGQFYYWEHFGLMDHPDYAKRAFSKLQLYYDAGIIPSLNLITTYETRDSPLSSELVEKIIHHYFV